MEGKHILRYDKNKWEEISSEPLNTLQLFITNRCNLRCKGCFYGHKLGQEEMSLETYKSHVLMQEGDIDKIILLGGEPTIHGDLEKMLEFNRSLGKKTTIYTNGFDLSKIENADMNDVSVRIGVYGSTSSEKPLSQVKRTTLPIDMVYMLRKDNVGELLDTANIASKEFNCKGFYISSIRDIAETDSYWKDTSETLNMDEYYSIVQNFVDSFDGDIKKLHIARRGVIETENNTSKVHNCRFANIFPDGEIIICPLDISRKVTADKIEFNKSVCNKHSECLLRKIVLKKKV